VAAALQFLDQRRDQCPIAGCGEPRQGFFHQFAVAASGIAFARRRLRRLVEKRQHRFQRQRRLVPIRLRKRTLRGASVAPARVFASARSASFIPSVAARR
jgi:hypothetical protein